MGINRNLEETAQRLLQIGVDVIVLDTAHGHQEKMIEAVRKVRAIIGPYKALCAGNVVSAGAQSAVIDTVAPTLSLVSPLGMKGELPQSCPVTE